MNRILYNPSDGTDKFFETLIEDDFDIQLKSESNKYIVFDGTTKILYEGDMPHCFLYAKWYRKFKGFWPNIRSIECYYEMLNDVNKAISIWDYIETLEGNKKRFAIDLCTKYQIFGKNPDSHIAEIIKEVEKFKEKINRKNRF